MRDDNFVCPVHKERYKTEIPCQVAGYCNYCPEFLNNGCDGCGYNFEPKKIKCSKKPSVQRGK